VVCYHVATPLSKLVGAALYYEGKWTQGTTPPFESDGPVAAVRYGAEGCQLAVVTYLDGHLQCWTFDERSEEGWTQRTTWPAPNATSGAGIGRFNNTCYVIYRGVDGRLHYVASSDWTTWTPDQAIPETIVASVAAPLWGSPAVAVLGSTMVVVYLTPTLPDETAPRLTAIVTTDGTTWSEPDDVAEAMSQVAASVTATADTFVCVYVDLKKNVCYTTSVDGVSWSDPAAFPTGHSTFPASLVAVGTSPVCVHSGKSNVLLWYSTASVD
jgi:hypothetical protein